MRSATTSKDVYAGAKLPMLNAWESSSLCNGFMGRVGGVSSGPYASLNLARWVGDDLHAVDENWRRWSASHRGMRIASLRQVHGNIVHRIDHEFGYNRPDGDGMVTAERGVCLAVFSADCVPILLADFDRRIVGALHAGWRGALADISTAGVRELTAIGARTRDLRAALGPSIGPCCFEVDSDLAERFASEIPDVRAQIRQGSPGKAYMDLRGIVRGQLTRAGLDPASIVDVGPCTRCAYDRYFSRRAAGGVSTGLQMSFIGVCD